MAASKNLNTEDFESRFSAIEGPIRLPLETDGKITHFLLTYYEFGGERWVAACLGKIAGPERVLLRIESACFFGHVMGSRQCDCGFQLDQALRLIAEAGHGLVIYAVDQDARGLGIADHFRIYRYRQNDGLDTDEVFERLGAALDNRKYDAVPRILRHLGVGPVMLLSNNKERLGFLQRSGIDVERQSHQATLDYYNMATLMLEKEDLANELTFKTHSSWLQPLQDAVGTDVDLRAACIVENNEILIAEWSGRDWDVAQHLLGALPKEYGPIIVYLSDFPRLDEIDRYVQAGARFIVVPFASVPPLLLKRAEAHGAKLQDWGRQNRYAQDRPQWHPLKSSDGGVTYVRGNERRTVGDS
jgi:GTP cyclohydrolase II